MINLNQHPDHVYSVQSGEHVEVDGQAFVVTVLQRSDDEDQVYLTTLDSRGLAARSSYELLERTPYGELYTHLRVASPYMHALFSREQLIELLKSGNYQIS